ncbi:MAG TPA: hypothetical protein VM101_04425 [Flavitalea sp.]|nr:hypothetical protein [Flavitalea sp.]
MSKKLSTVLLFVILITSGVYAQHQENSDWEISVIPSSIRLDPVTSEIIENRFVLNKNKEAGDILKHNWIYDGQSVSLKAARGEYISFQLVVTNKSSAPLKQVKVNLPSFGKSGKQLGIAPELFLVWSSEIKTPSTGYPTASLGKGWYPEALIPFKYIQDDSSQVHGRWTYPLWIPDFNNRIENQRSMIVWVDQYVPYKEEEATPGVYSSSITVSIGKTTRKIPVKLNVWNFALPNENRLKASLQEEGFLSSMSEEDELEMYQLFKRNRVGLMDPTYQPILKVSADKKVSIDWKSFDKRLKKYFTGEAFTAAKGYEYGPGYGEPLETFILPFDVYGKHHTKGWPDTGTPDVERKPENIGIYENTVRAVRSHLKPLVDTQKTELYVYLNGLDESYDRFAQERMVYYGNLFHKIYPEIKFRIDGAYDDQAMEFLHNSIDAWGSHTINYNLDKVKKYQKLGLRDWLYGPMLYEGKVNSWVGSLTFTDLPLVNERAISWSCWKYGTYSWISWGAGVNGKGGWYDPETWKDQYKGGADSDPEFTYKKINGSALYVYSGGIIPNVSGACPSIRLKNLRNGVQEYEMMRLLKKLDGNDSRVNEIVNGVIKEPFGDKSIGNLDIWNYDASVWDESRIKIGDMINEAVKR